MITDGPPAARGRVSREHAISELRRLRSSAAAPAAIESVPAPMAILNAQRQVIFSNAAFQELASAESLEAVCGLRPGEAFGCRHSDGGCGEGEACGFCGAREAIARTEDTGETAVRECHIERAGSPGTARELLVRTSPFEIEGVPYVLLSLTDVSHLSRRGALERIFFHDLLNTASSFRVSLELLRRGDLPEERRGVLLDRLAAACDALEEEIQGQRIMVGAEQGTLKAQRNLIETRELVEQVRRQAEGLRCAEGRSVAVAPFAESFAFVSDDSLVKRILLNMLKNALEATPAGGSVTVGARRHPGGDAELTVHNTGFMPRQVQLQVFHRYFSTKGEGRGLGTWGMKLLAQEYLGGRVEFATNPVEGTTFSLFLPQKPACP